MGFNSVRKLDAITQLPALRVLNATRNKIISLRGWPADAPLQVAKLAYNGITSLVGLAELSNLEELWLGNNAIATVSDLHQYVRSAAYIDR